MSDRMRESMPEGEEAPPKGVHAMAILRWALLGLVITAALFTVAGWLLAPPRTAPTTDVATPEEQHQKYHCPMHPQIVSDQPGQCPICQMSLVPLAPAKATTAADAPAVADLAAVDAPVDRLQAMGVRVEAVTRERLGETLRTVGRVAPDEGRLARVQLRFAGYVEQVLVAQQGARVRKGEPLMAVQSDEILRLEDELLQARTWGGDLAERARQRLRLLGVSSEEISHVETHGKADGVVLIRSPAQGDVIGLDVIAGDRVEPGRVLFEVADLARVWVIADVHERELSRVRVDLGAKLTLDAYPGKVFAGRIGYVSSRLDPQSRTLAVRIALPNPGGELKPGLFGSVDIQLPRSEGLTVSSEAIIDTGSSRYVFVETTPGHFEPRVVATGERAGDRLQVLSGLKEGDRVATGGNFFIDSESRLRASVAQSPALPATAGAKP